MTGDGLRHFELAISAMLLSLLGFFGWLPLIDYTSLSFLNLIFLIEWSNHFISQMKDRAVH
jgi:hypothetical protein